MSEMSELTCKDNFLHLNTSKTKEIVFDFRTSKRSELMSIKIKDENIETVETYKLSWADQCTTVLSKSQQRMYFFYANEIVSRRQYHFKIVL